MTSSTLQFASNLLLSLPPSTGGSKAGGDSNQHPLLPSVKALLPNDDEDESTTSKLLSERHDIRTCRSKKAASEEGEGASKNKKRGSSEDVKELLAKAVDTKLSDFLETLYGSKANVISRHAVEIQQQQQSDDKKNAVVLIVRTYAELVDNPNKLSGYCAGEWTCEPVSEQVVYVAGQLDIHAASEEKANCHLRLSRTLPRRKVETAEEKVNAIVAKMEARRMSYEEKVAKKLVQYLTKSYEEAYRDVTNRLYGELDENLKLVRRILPVTKTRFKWDVAAQKQVTLLKERETD